VEDFLITALAEPAAEVGEGSAAGDGIVRDSSKAPIRTAQFGIAQDETEVFAISDLVEIAP
jgi:hypothetical protein